MIKLHIAIYAINRKLSQYQKLRYAKLKVKHFHNTNFNSSNM